MDFLHHNNRAVDRRLRCVTFESDQCTEQHSVHVYKKYCLFWLIYLFCTKKFNNTILRGSLPYNGPRPNTPTGIQSECFILIGLTNCFTAKKHKLQCFQMRKNIWVQMWQIRACRHPQSKKPLQCYFKSRHLKPCRSVTYVHTGLNYISTNQCIVNTGNGEATPMHFTDLFLKPNKIKILSFTNPFEEDLINAKN